jgi:hypothetical protein
MRDSYSNIVEGYLKKASQIAKDQTLSDTYKHSQIVNLQREALQQLEGLHQAENNVLTTQKEQLAKTSKTPFAPKPEQAALMLYVRDALAARYQRIDPNDFVSRLREDWQTALDQDDMITARVMADFYAEGYNDDLIEATYDRLFPESQKARADLKITEATLRTLPGEFEEAEIKIQKSQFTPQGEVVDGVMAAFIEQTRRGF